MTPERARLVTEFLRRSEAAYSVVPDDFPSTGNTLWTYSQDVNQWKYVHMYFAKYVGCWRWIRQWLKNPADGNVFSVGAGPCLCLLGWFFDRPPMEGEKIEAIDILPWLAVRNDASFKALTRHVMDGAKRLYTSNVYFPPGDPPPQSREIQLGQLSSLVPSSFPQDATVLVPFVLNHLLGFKAPHPVPEDVFDWLEAVRKRVKRVVVVDMQHENSTSGFWEQLSEGLGLDVERHVFEFPTQVREFGDCYSNPVYASRRTGGRSPKMYQASGVLGTAKGWSYIF